MKQIIILLAIAIVIIIGWYVYANPEATPVTVTYDNGPYTFETAAGDRATISYTKDGTQARLVLSEAKDVKYDLTQARSASGARYESDNGSVVFWEHQGEATIEKNGQTIFVGAINDIEENDDVLTFIVSPEKADCVGVAPRKCLVVNGKNFFSDIDGFTFEPGFTYDLTVERIERDTVPADANQYTYRLVEEVSKTAAGTNGKLVGTPWQWTGTVATDGSVIIEPADPSAFMLTFMDGGHFSATTDCNNIMGSYEASQSDLTFGQIASTKRACRGETQEQEFTDSLGNITQFMVDNEGQATLKLLSSTTAMTFVAAE